MTLQQQEEQNPIHYLTDILISQDYEYTDFLMDEPDNEQLKDPIEREEAILKQNKEDFIARYQVRIRKKIRELCPILTRRLTKRQIKQIDAECGGLLELIFCQKKNLEIQRSAHIFEVCNQALHRPTLPAEDLVAQYGERIIRICNKMLPAEIGTKGLSSRYASLEKLKQQYMMAATAQTSAAQKIEFVKKALDTDSEMLKLQGRIQKAREIKKALKTDPAIVELQEKIQKIDAEVKQKIETCPTIVKIKNMMGNMVSEVHKCKKNKRAIFQTIRQCRNDLNLAYPIKLDDPNMFSYEIDRYSNALCTGQLSVLFDEEENVVFTLPRLIPFPVRHSVYFSHDVGKTAIINFILRTVLCLPLEQITISVMDPVGLGNSLGDLKTLLSFKHLFPAGRFLTRSQEIEDELDQQLRYVEGLIQNVFNSQVPDWDAYNKLNPAHQLPYRLLAVFYSPDSFTDKSISYLSKLLKHGPQYGVLPLLFMDCDGIPNDKRFDSFSTDIEKYCRDYRTLFNSLLPLPLKAISIEETGDEVLPVDKIQKIVSCIANRLSELGKTTTSQESFGAISLWNGNSAEAISVSVGRNKKDNADLTLSIGDPPNPSHILLGGKTGSGKSNFLHVLICGLCSKYSPDELQFYLLDYKEGTEFNFYANPILPHARLIATQSDIEYGRTVLRHLRSEHQSRSELFKASHVANYRDYRQKTNCKLPRILLIVDEFQKLFESRDLAVTNEISSIINDLLRQGRSSGIHILLATQTIHGLQNSQLLSNLSGRIALSCTQEDSALILGGSNFAAAELPSCGEAILNTENGVKSANRHFAIPLADPNYRQTLLSELNRKAKAEHISLQNTVFYGDMLPEIPAETLFANCCGGSEFRLLLGRRHNFNEDPFSVELAKDNLLIAGWDKTLRTGILNSALLSLKQAQPSVKILYLNSANDSIDLLPSVQFDDDHFIRKDRSWNADDLGEFISRKGKKVIIIDSYDYASCLQNRNQTRYGRKPQDPKSPYEILCEIADPTSPVQDVCILLFVEDYDRFSGSTRAKELFEYFDLRIGFGMDEDLAGRFVRPGSGYGKFSGIADSSKAVFVNVKTNDRYLVRPFVLPAK